MPRTSFDSRFMRLPPQFRLRPPGRTAWTSIGLAMTLLGLCLKTQAQVITFEGNAFPETFGWQRLPSGPPQGERLVEDGWFFQTVVLPDGWPEPTGEYNFYRISVAQFVGSENFFVEWRAVTDNPAWLIDEWHVPAVVSAAGKAASLYHTTLTESAAALLRDIRIPRIVAAVWEGTPHVYRVEIFANQYRWYIDGSVTDTGIPEGPYPDVHASITWGVGREYVDATTAWDYVRTGRIPDDASGDYDSNAALTLTDHYFVGDCLTKNGPGIFGGPGENAGPGCRFADFDADSDTDLVDFAEFQNSFGG